MKTQILAIFLFLITLPYSGVAQFSVKAQGGLSYIEHFSVGATFTMKGKHNLSMLYGSNFFINTSDFYSWMLQYDLLIPKLKFSDVTPRIGVKGGDNVFTNEYYQWRVFTVVPFLGVTCPMNKKVDLFLEAGAAFSFEQTIRRVSLGEIGHYKDLLPELKAGVLYTIYKK